MNQAKFIVPLTCLFIGLITVSAVAQRRAANAAAPVVAGRVCKVNRIETETFVGTLQAKRRSVVGSAVDGRVVELNVEPGDPVGADPTLDSALFVGQPMIQLRTDTLDIEIGSAEIQLRLAEQAYQELLISLPNELELAEKNAAELKARLNFSQGNFERIQRLGEEAIAQGEVDQARSQFQAEQKAAEAAAVTFRNLSATERLRKQQAKLQIQSAKQELSRLNDLREKYTVRAPFAGFVTQKLTEVGEWVSQGQAIVEVVQIDPIELLINVPQVHLKRLQQSLNSSNAAEPLTAQVAFDGIDERFTGIVKRVVAQGDLRSRTFPVRVELDNPKLKSGFQLQPGMLGRADLMIGYKREMLVVKKDALVLGGRQPLVYKLIGDGDDVMATPVVVRTGVAIEDWIQVSGNLTADDNVVLLGNERLRSGQKLMIKEMSEEAPPQ